MAVGGGLTEEALEALLDNALAGVVAGAVIRKIAKEVFEWARVNLCSTSDLLSRTEELLTLSNTMTRKVVALKGQLGG